MVRVYCTVLLRGGFHKANRLRIAADPVLLKTLHLANLDLSGPMQGERLF